MKRSRALLPAKVANALPPPDVYLINLLYQIPSGISRKIFRR
jgi:hypothetical protein